MKYKAVYVCYLTRKGNQKQKCFISKTTDRVRISDETDNIDKELHMPLIDVKFFTSKKEALKDARIYCPDNDIYDMTKN